MDVSVDNRIDVESVGTVEVAVGNAADVIVADDHALDITVTKKEYKIVGDEVYIAKLYEDAPQWMKDLVQLVVDNTMASESTALLNDLVSQLNKFATSYVPLNTYTQSILDLSNADQSLHANLETLNSNFNDGLNTANSQIINLALTKASKDEVTTKVVETLAAQLFTPTSELGAIIGNLQQAIVDGDSANADSITTLTSSLEGEVDARAAAVSALTTRVSNVEGTTTSQAAAITNLTTELNNGTTTWATADSSVVNSLTTTINNGDAAVQAKWAYNSTVAINGVYKKSGFGLTSNYSGGSGTVGDPYLSEFWIDATKLKFTNSAATGRTAPFTIDASGTTPQITFNGKVSFSNVTDVPQLGSTPQEVVNAVNTGNTTTIDGGKITTGTIATLQFATHAVTADKIAAEAITADKIKAGEVTASKLAVMGLSTFTNDVGYTSFKTFMQTTQPSIANIGDLWIDTDDNNKTYRYNGTTWDVTTFDAAVAINKGTTTISGAKITTGSITADKINTTGLIAENISATTISGKTITSSIINASTINLGDLNVVNSAGYAAYGVFYANWAVSATYVSNIHTCTFTSDLYTFNSTNSSKYRLKNNTNGRLFFDFPYPIVPSLVGTVMAQQICYTSGTLYSLSVSIYVGSTLFTSKTTEWTQNVWYELGGIGFMYYFASASDQRLLMRLDNPNIKVEGTASDAIIKIVTSANLGGATDTYLTSGTLCRTFISNL